MEERMKFIHEWERGEEWSFAEMCRRYGVSRKTGYKWLGRYQEHGMAGLADRGTAPHEHPNQVQQSVIDAVIEAREKHPRWGPKKLRVLGQKRPKVQWPAASTMGEVLKRAGLTAPRKKQPRVPACVSALHTAEEPNQVWCADYKGYFECQDGTRCDPFTLTDDFSRYLLRCQVVVSLEERYARALLETAFREYGLPAAIRTDNGSPFASVALAGLSELAVWWIKLGIRPERIRAGKPQQNGRHERMHRTLKETTATPPAKDLRAQQQALSRFRQEYNHERPHEGLGMQVPAAVYRSSSGPIPIGYNSQNTKPAHWSAPWLLAGAFDGMASVSLSPRLWATNLSGWNQSRMEYGACGSASSRSAGWMKPRCECWNSNEGSELGIDVI
jgi:transposase InsO family protein